MWLLTLCNTIVLILMLAYGRSPVHVSVQAPSVKLAPSVHKRTNGGASPAPMVKQPPAQHARTSQGWHPVRELE